MADNYMQMSVILRSLYFRTDKLPHIKTNLKLYKLHYLRFIKKNIINTQNIHCDTKNTWECLLNTYFV